MSKFNTETINEQNITNQERLNEGAIEDISDKEKFQKAEKRKNNKV